METDGHIVKVEEPAEWVSLMTVSVRNEEFVSIPKTRTLLFDVSIIQCSQSKRS